MRIILFFLLTFSFTLNGQVCVTLDSWTQNSDNGDGTCTYQVSLIVNSGNGASGTATFSIDGVDVHVEPNCICNPTTISFPITVICESTVNIDVFYDAPGNGNDCSGSTGGIVLPIIWNDLSVNKHQNYNLIEWSTYMEKNNENFIVEHSENGKTFHALDLVQSAGNTNKTSYYSYLHERPQATINYYRIKQVDFDGRFSLSEIIQVDNTIQNLWAYPNPFQDEIHIPLEQDKSWDLFDSVGKRTLSGSNNIINTEQLLKGMYILKVEGASNPQILIKS